MRRLSRLKYRPRYQRRSTMNPTSRKIPDSETRIALAMSQARLRFANQLESDAIAQSKAGLGLAVFAILSRDKAGNVLTLGEAIAQSAAISTS